MAKKFQDKADLRRPRGRRVERSRVLIVTEGECTEVQYFKNLCKHLRATGTNVMGVDVKGAGRDPSNVVNKAGKASQNGSLIGREGGYDAVWCVFDVDEHEKLEAATELARKRGFKLAISNPCFEVWLLWHFEDCYKHLSTDQAGKMLKKHGVLGKNMPENFDYGNSRKARSRAESALEDIPVNPGSRVWVLVDHLESGKRVGS
ncbi:RloB family protein [Saccharopolyspora gloriosae]|uniref:RloB family protein n=1 Tax=Saccharopolyspora gloriosae TaxID=455344 RepID=UPI001FB848CA|nr:RloB family protein [Saccharopolyspora gloriosae]